MEQILTLSNKTDTLFMELYAEPISQGYKVVECKIFSPIGLYFYFFGGGYNENSCFDHLESKLIADFVSFPLNIPLDFIGTIKSIEA